MPSSRLALGNNAAFTASLYSQMRHISISLAAPVVVVVVVVVEVVFNAMGGCAASAPASLGALGRAKLG